MKEKKEVGAVGGHRLPWVPGSKEFMCLSGSRT